jgi:transcriptional regulator with XRE-family HTH domain
MKNIANNISFLRKEKGLGQREMAGVLGITSEAL